MVYHHISTDKRMVYLYFMFYMIASDATACVVQVQDFYQSMALVPASALRGAPIWR